MNNVFFLLFFCFTFLTSFAQQKDEAFINKLSKEFESRKASLLLPLVNSKVDFKTLYLDENRRPLRGVDIISKDSFHIKSPMNGFVTAIFPDEEKHVTVIVCHGDYFLVYTHVEKAFITQGQSISEGMYIGTAPLDKNSMYRTHIEIWHNADKLWPPDWFKKP